MTVIEYVTEEVSRQGHDVLVLDGIQRVGWMLTAWCHALMCSTTHLPLMHTAEELGQMIEPFTNHIGFRIVDVRVGSRMCPPPDEVRGRLMYLFETRDVFSPLEFYKAFEEIHPFEDGNGRTGKVLLNWLNGTLLNPIFPPADLWGRPILHP